MWLLVLSIFCFKTQVGVFYRDKKDLSEENVVITRDGMGWRIKTQTKTKNDLIITWHLELADGTKLTRKAPVNLYIHGS